MIIKSNETCSVAVLTANSNNINYPVTNILRSTGIFRTVTGITTATIVFDCQAAVTVNSIDIFNHNISSGVTTLKWQGNATDSWGSPSVDETLTYSSGIINKDFTGGSYRYWRLNIIDAGNTDTFIKLGRVFGANSLTAPCINFNISDSYQTETKKQRTPSGITYGDVRPNYQVLSINWPIITTAVQKPELKTMFDSVDISKPFFITFDELIIDLGTVYITIDGNGLHFVYLENLAYSKASISFIEEL